MASAVKCETALDVEGEPPARHANGLRSLRATRIVKALEGSSWPVLVETPAGYFVTKLRGAAQGVLPLIAEVIASAIALSLDLPVPEHALIHLDASVPSDDRRDELADVLAKSYGQNLGVRYLERATILRHDQMHLLNADLAARILWFDGLLVNPDRTPANPNLLIAARRPWLIDHGAALSFHYDWGSVTEQSPRAPGPPLSHHLFGSRTVGRTDVDDVSAARLTRSVLTAAVDAIPPSFLRAAYADDAVPRARRLYEAFLWKRLKAPRPFWPP